MPAKYEPVRHHGLERPFNKLQGMAVGAFAATAIASNALVPLATAHPHITLPWLLANDMMGLVTATAAVQAASVDPAVPAIKEKLADAENKGDQCEVNVQLGEIYRGHCYICDVDVPPRTKHCKICNKCVSVFDHHCGFLNNCIGEDNHKPFVTALSSAITYATSTMTLQITSVILEYLQDTNEPAMMPIWLWAAMNIASATFLTLPLAFLLKVLGYQLRAMMQGLTQYEWFKAMSRSKRAKEGTEEEEEESEDEDDLEEVVVEKPAVVVDYSWLRQ